MFEYAPPTFSAVRKSGSESGSFNSELGRKPSNYSRTDISATSRRFGSETRSPPMNYSRTDISATSRRFSSETRAPPNYSRTDISATSERFSSEIGARAINYSRTDISATSGRFSSETRAPRKKYSRTDVSATSRRINSETKAPGFSSSTMVPSMDALDRVIHQFTPSLSDVKRRGGPEEEMEKEEYMITMKNLKELRIPEDGLLANLARSHYDNNTLHKIILPGLRDQIDEDSVKIFSKVARYCLNPQRSQRPTIYQVIDSLKEALEYQVEYDNFLLNEETGADAETNQVKWEKFEHLEIKFDAIDSATDGFSEERILGGGTYGSVYEGKLDFNSCMKKSNTKDSELPKKPIKVAIKKTIPREDEQGKRGFLAELEALYRCKNDNIVSLLGYCYKPPDHMILVYELASNGSLEDYLQNKGKKANLTWVERLNILIGIAKGLNHLHTSKPEIIHRDIKSANILLNERWEAKIADFGFSRSDVTAGPIQTSTIAGTQRYMDPEYQKSGTLSKESDVYSFGVVMFEMLTGRLTSDSIYTNKNPMGLAPLVRQEFKSHETLKKMIDSKLEEESDGRGFGLNVGPDKESVEVFLKIGYQCLSEQQKERPQMKTIIKELEKALNLQENRVDSLQISFEDIARATHDFSEENVIGKGGFGTVYRGDILHYNDQHTCVAVKRNDPIYGQGQKEFATEIEILKEYKHDNIINLVGYCMEGNERICVLEYASRGSLDRHLKNVSLTWMKRLKIARDIAIGLEFLHGGGHSKEPVIHRDIKSGNILLDDDWRAKITDFGLSLITAMDDENDFKYDTACGTLGYVDPQFAKTNLLTRESDIYSLGVVLSEMMCGRMAALHDSRGKYIRGSDLASRVQRYKVKGKLDELVFEGIKDKLVQESLTTYQSIMFRCLSSDRAERPKAKEVVEQLNKALESQENIEIWEAILPIGYKEIIQMSKTPDIYSDLSKRDLHEKFTKGILHQNAKVCFSVGGNGERNLMITATTSSNKNNKSNNCRSIKKSSFGRVLQIMDNWNLRTQIKINTQYLFPDVIYGVHLVFKFCDPRKTSSQLMYINLKYQMGNETRHAYFATRKDKNWMMTELCRIIPKKKDVDFEVLLESMSPRGAIFIEGLHFRAINDAILRVKPVDGKINEAHEQALKSNVDFMQPLSADYDEITEQEHDEKSLLVSNPRHEKKCHMLPAKSVLYDSADAKCFNWECLSESRFKEEAELLSQPLFRIKCDIETQNLSPDTNYACFLVFRLSQKCQGLRCPVKARDLLLRKNKEFRILYFRSPRLVTSHAIEMVPKQREDGLMEVMVWEFNLGYNVSDGQVIPMSLKLRCYEGTFSGLIIYGVEFRPL